VGTGVDFAGVRADVDLEAVGVDLVDVEVEVEGVGAGVDLGVDLAGV
jgi:hypothetical protein